jgi:hypothetical protein
LRFALAKLRREITVDHGAAAGSKCLTTIDSTDLHAMHFTPVGDQLDANEDLHGDLRTAIAVLKS